MDQLVNFEGAATGTGNSGTYMVLSDTGAAQSLQSSGIVLDTAFHVHKLIFNPSNTQFVFDGNLVVTKGSNVPNDNGQPCFTSRAASSGAKIANIRYLEVYNT